MIIRGNIKLKVGDTLIFQGPTTGSVEEKIISIEKNHFYYNSRAIANISLRKYIFALNDFNEAININSEYLNAYKNRSRLYYQLGDFPKSIKDAQKACTLGDCSLLKLNEKNTN
jgi:tetratricopeptide (TPR) repeat protein